MIEPLSPADVRAEQNWLKYRQLKERDAEWESAVRPVEYALRTEIRTSVRALACVLMIQINEGDEECEEVPDLWRASLAAIRPQLVGAIAEDADHVLATIKEREDA
jgi:hypothetical protein